MPVTVIIPAVVEPEVNLSIEALLDQTLLPDRIIVAVNNTNDPTTRRSALSVKSSTVEVLDLGEVEGKKAGALNKVLSDILPSMDGNDFVLVQDADSILDPEFIENAMNYMNADPLLGAVGGTFRGQSGGGFVGHLQRNEFSRYARDVRRLKGKCLVVTGTAALFRVSTLNKVSASRISGTIPPGNGVGGVYDTTVLTEDNEISFALMHLGYKILSPSGCTLTTEVMPTWKDLWRQRLRWKRGAVENCVQYGFTKVTAPYWGRQIFTMLGVIVTAIYIGSLVWAMLIVGSIFIHPFWLAVTGVFALERVVTLHDRGVFRQLLAGTFYELPFDLFLQVCHGKAYLDSLLRLDRNW